MKQIAKRTRRQFDFGEKFGYMLAEILPTEVANIAATTCRIEIRGKHGNRSDANRHKGFGEAVYVSLQTYGEEIKGLNSAFKKTGSFISTTSNEAADLILGCFGLSMDDVRAYFGTPGDYDSMFLDLTNVVELLAPELLTTERTRQTA
jgi:hypothetical protein